MSNSNANNNNNAMKPATTARQLERPPRSSCSPHRPMKTRLRLREEAQMVLHDPMQRPGCALTSTIRGAQGSHTAVPWCLPSSAQYKAPAKHYCCMVQPDPNGLWGLGTHSGSEGMG